MKKLYLILFLLILPLFLIGCTNTNPSSTTTKPSPTPTPTQESKTEQFNKEARQKLDDVATAIHELSEKGIECFEGDCSVVYFNFAILPQDYETIIRGNTATLSKLKKDITGVSHVSVSALLNSSSVIKCEGSSGKVDKCE